MVFVVTTQDNALTYHISFHNNLLSKNNHGCFITKAPLTSKCKYTLHKSSSIMYVQPHYERFAFQQFSQSKENNKIDIHKHISHRKPTLWLHNLFVFNHKNTQNNSWGTKITWPMMAVHETPHNSCKMREWGKNHKKRNQLESTPILEIEGGKNQSFP